MIREQVRIAFGHVPAVLLGANLAMVLIAFAFANHVSTPRVLGGLFLIVTISTLRILSYLSFRKISAGDFPARIWRKYFLTGVTASSLGWGVVTFLLFPSDGSMAYGLLLACLISGMTASVLVSHSSLKAAPPIWIAGTVLPMAFSFFNTGGELGRVMGILCLLFGLIVSIFAVKIYASIKSSITLRLKNLELVGEVQSTADNFQKVLDFAPEPIVLHYGGRFIYSNRAAAELAGAKSGDELRGRPIEPDQSSKSEVEERLRRLQNGETLPPAVLKYKDLAGRVISLEVASALITYKGSPAIITACRDVTKRQAEEEELRRSKKEAEDAVVLKDKYLALVSDDLRSPLASVKALLNNLLEKTGLRKGVDVPTTVGKALSDCDSMLMTIDNILNAGKVRGGTWRLNLETADARFICEEAVSGLLPLAQSKGIEVVNNVPEGRSFRVDKGLFLQVVQNLASNAIKFSGKGDTVTIFIPDGKENAIAVKDTGSGILPEILKDIFSADVRTTSVGSQGETGHGVGLPLCQDIMTAHRGRLTAESQPGAGSLFVAELPSSKPRVLVVEDDPATRFLLCLELAQRNMEVIEAANGETALKVLGGVKPDLIITDLDMPSMDGVTFIGHARQDRSIAAVPIVVYSSGGPENRKAAIEKGANEFVHKSRPTKELMLVVARHFA